MGMIRKILTIFFVCMVMISLTMSCIADDREQPDEWLKVYGRDWDLRYRIHNGDIFTRYWRLEGHIEDGKVFNRDWDLRYQIEDEADW